MEWFIVDGASTIQQVDSLNQDIHERDEEIRRLISLLEAREDVAEGSGGGGGGGGGEGESGHMEMEISDVRAELEEEKDKRMRAEEELKNLQVCGIWLPCCVHIIIVSLYAKGT